MDILFSLQLCKSFAARSPDVEGHGLRVTPTTCDIQLRCVCVIYNTYFRKYFSSQNDTTRFMYSSLSRFQLGIFHVTFVMSPNNGCTHGVAVAKQARPVSVILNPFGCFCSEYLRPPICRSSCTKPFLRKQTESLFLCGGRRLLRSALLRWWCPGRISIVSRFLR